MDHSYINMLTDIIDNSVRACMLQDSNGENKIRLHIVAENGLLLQPIDMPLDEPKKGVRSLIRMGFDSFRAAQIVRTACETPLNTIIIPANLGWQRNEQGDITGYACGVVLDKHGNEIIKDPYAGFPDTSGKLADAITWFAEFLNQNTLRQIVFLHSLGGLICGLLNRSTMLALVSTSSKGKSIISNVAQAIYCAPNYDPLNKTWASTEMALAKSLNNLTGVGVVIDDTQLSRTKSFQQIIYELNSGVSRQRLVKGNQLAQPHKWAVSILTTAENSILSTCNRDDEGVLPRCMEIMFTPHGLFHSAKDANDAKTRSESNYGTISPAFASYLLKKDLIGTIAGNHKSQVERIKSAVTDTDSVLMRCIDYIAIISLTSVFATQAFGMTFDIPQIEDYLLETCRENIEMFRAEQVQSNIMNIIFPQLVKLAKEKFSENRKNEYIVIPSDAYKNLVQSMTLNTPVKLNIVKKALLEHNAVYMPRGNYSDTYTIGGRSIRGIALKIDVETMEESKCA